jgi:RNA polymerase sigma-70 factor (ECF subfamily)
MCVVDQRVKATPLELAYERQGAQMIRALTAYAGSRDIAEDAVAEAFARALQHEDEIRDLAPWLWRVAFRVAAAEAVRVSRPATEVPAATEAPSEDAADLIRALGQLSPKQRAAVLLHHYAGHPVRDVASIIGSTPPAVRVHLSTGRSRLRKILEQDDE